MKKLILLVTVAFVLFSCKNLAEGEFIITGNVKGIKTGLAYLEKQGPMGMSMAVDTVKIVDGAFEFKGKATEPEIQFIQIEKVLGKIPVIVEGGEIKVEVNKDSLVKSKITGTYSNEEFTKFNEETAKIQKKIKPQVDQFKTTNADLIAKANQGDLVAQKALNDAFEPIQKPLTDYTFGYPKTHPKSFISVFIIQMMMGNPKNTPKEIETLYNSLDASLKKTKPAKSIKEAIDASKKKPTTNPQPSALTK